MWRRLLPGLLLLVAVGVAAQSQGSKEAEQVRRLRLQVQKLQQDLGAQQAAQQAIEQAAQADKTKAESESRRRHGQIAALQRQLREQRVQNEQAQERLLALQRLADERQRAGEQLQQRLAQAEAGQRSTAGELQAVRADLVGQQRQLGIRSAALANLSERHSVQTRGLQTCIDSNRALREIGLDLLQRYATQTVADVLARDEPFLQYRRVAIENLMQDYQDKLDRQALPSGASPGAQAAGDARSAGGARAP